MTWLSTTLIREAATDLLELGAEWADTPKQLAESADLIFTSLPGPPEVNAVSIGEDGLIEGVSSGSIWIDLSTSSPTLIRELSKNFEKQGASVLDAPVSGGVKGAQTGKLAIMVGGNEKIFNQIKPVLDSFGDKVSYTGSIGSGRICK